jgi:hypothetical protein
MAAMAGAREPHAMVNAVMAMALRMAAQQQQHAEAACRRQHPQTVKKQVAAAGDAGCPK